MSSKRKRSIDDAISMLIAAALSIGIGFFMVYIGIPFIRSLIIYWPWR